MSLRNRAFDNSRPIFVETLSSKFCNKKTRCRAFYCGLCISVYDIFFHSSELAPPEFLSKIILEVVCYLLVEVYGILAKYVMLGARIWEIIHLHVVFDTLSNEAE